MENATDSGSIEEWKEESNLIIYIVGLKLLIIWKVRDSDVPSASALEAQPVGGTGGERASTATGTSFMMWKSEYNTFLFTV